MNTYEYQKSKSFVQGHSDLYSVLPNTAGHNSQISCGAFMMKGKNNVGHMTKMATIPIYGFIL